MGWIALPIVAPYLWPKYEPKDRRGITQEEHQSLLAKEKNAEWKLYLELLWETGAAQSDAASFTAEAIDRQTRTISYFRQKTGSLAQFTVSTALEKVLQQLPTSGVLFPNLSTWTESDRASRFRRRCHRAGVSGVTLHSYRYAWAERAKVVGMPERFAQAALGHNSKAIHRAYAKKAVIIAPSLEDYEKKAATSPPMIDGLKIKRRLSFADSTAFCFFGDLHRPQAPAPEAWPLDSVIRSRWPERYAPFSRHEKEMV